MLNNLTLMGRLTRDPKLRHTQSGTPVASYTLAVNRDFETSGNKETDFIDVVAWKKAAEFADSYFRKGQLVAVVGRIQTRKWSDKEGNNRVSVEVVAERQYFAEGKNKAEPASPHYAADTSTANPGDFMELDVSDDELPF